MKKVGIIGAGFSGLSAACFAAKAGFDVSVFEKNETIGGRARSFNADGFHFDMGPSWYWMPDVFDRFFEHFGKKTSDYYELLKLDPGFQIIYGKDDILEVPANQEALFENFEKIEKGSAAKLSLFLKEAKDKYEIGMNKLVYKPAYSWFEFASMDVIKAVSKMNIFSTVSSYVRQYFKDPRLIALLEFPVLFLGAMPHKIPALYTLMNHAALSQGTYYPQGGMIKIIEGMQQLAEELGVKFLTNTAIEKIEINNKTALQIRANNKHFNADAIIATADYHHIESKLLDQQYRNYSEEYWSKKTFAPSCLIFYVGVNKILPKLLHHNLYFDTDFEQHSKDIYDQAAWPKEPLFYVCCPSKTDHTVAPKDMENLFFLIPIAIGLEDSEAIRESYFKKLVKRVEAHIGETFEANIVYKKSYCTQDFVSDYNAYKGNAYGLANTLMQTAVLKPTLKNKQVDNLFYAGQLTVPGPGVPPSIISGQIAAEQTIKYLQKR